MQLKLTNRTQNNRALSGGGPLLIVPFAENGAHLALDGITAWNYADDIRATFKQQAISVAVIGEGGEEPVTSFQELNEVLQELRTAPETKTQPKSP